MDFNKIELNKWENNHSKVTEETCYADYIISSKNNRNDTNFALPIKFRNLLTEILRKERDNIIDNPEGNNVLIKENIFTDIKMEYQDIYGKKIREKYFVKFKIETQFNNLGDYIEKYIKFTFVKDDKEDRLV